MEEPVNEAAEDTGEALVGLIPFVGPLIAPLGKRLARAVAREHRLNVSIALKAAERESGMSREDLAEAIADNPRLVPLLTRLLNCAGMNGQDQTLRLMGAALGNAAQSPERIDEADLILRVLEGLTSQHFALLRVIATPAPQLTDVGGALGWFSANLADVTGLSSDVLNICLDGLIGAGLIRLQEIMGGNTYAATATGHTVLQLLDRLTDP
jgi:hypothetical protein